MQIPDGKTTRNTAQDVSAFSNVAKQLAYPDTLSADIDPLTLYNAASKVNATILSGLQSYAQKGQLQIEHKDFQDNWSIFALRLSLDGEQSSPAPISRALRHCVSQRRSILSV